MENTPKSDINDLNQFFSSQWIYYFCNCMEENWARKSSM